jgi:hypothetical protein
MLAIFLAKTRTNISVSSEPIKAAAILSHMGTVSIYLSRNIITRPTTILAPEDMPRTKGPAIGFLKKVCSRKPETAQAPPNTAAAIRRGSRIFIIIFMLASDIVSEVLVNRIFITSSGLIPTVPVFIFSTTATHMAAIRNINTARYLRRLRAFVEGLISA